MKWPVLLLLCFISFTGCKKNDPGNPGENEVFLLYKQITPSQLVIKKGTTVKFISKDNSSHTVSAYSGLFDSGTIKSEGVYEFRFDTTGTYNYYCKYHSLATEQATVIVQ